jgi:hypothetical protein
MSAHIHRMSERWTDKTLSHEAQRYLVLVALSTGILKCFAVHREGSNRRDKRQTESSLFVIAVSQRSSNYY